MLENILTCFGVVCAVGLVSGILLALASHFFRVEENETVKRVRECLPGANCGACGYVGCDDYAAAIAGGDAEPNLCIPGGESAAKGIAEVLGIEVSAVDSKVAFVNCDGNCKAAEHKAEYIGISSCKAETMLYGGDMACRFGCLGKGDCAAVCPVNAICIKDDVARINVNLCIGCGKCANSCPKHIISLVPKTAKALNMCNNKEKGADARRNCKNACIGCKKCEKICQYGAIKVENNLAVINFDKCTGCGECVENCPAKCLKKADLNIGKIGI